MVLIGWRRDLFFFSHTLEIYFDIGRSQGGGALLLYHYGFLTRAVSPPLI